MNPFNPQQYRAPCAPAALMRSPARPYDESILLNTEPAKDKPEFDPSQNCLGKTVALECILKYFEYDGRLLPSHRLHSVSPRIPGIPHQEKLSSDEYGTKRDSLLKDYLVVLKPESTKWIPLREHWKQLHRVRSCYHTHRTTPKIRISRLLQAVPICVAKLNQFTTTGTAWLIDISGIQGLDQSDKSTLMISESSSAQCHFLVKGLALEDSIFEQGSSEHESFKKYRTDLDNFKNWLSKECKIFLSKFERARHGQLSREERPKWQKLLKQCNQIYRPPVKYAGLVTMDVDMFHQLVERHRVLQESKKAKMEFEKIFENLEPYLKNGQLASFKVLDYQKFIEHIDSEAQKRPRGSPKLFLPYKKSTSIPDIDENVFQKLMNKHELVAQAQKPAASSVQATTKKRDRGDLTDKTAVLTSAKQRIIKVFEAADRPTEPAATSLRSAGAKRPSSEVADVRAAKRQRTNAQSSPNEQEASAAAGNASDEAEACQLSDDIGIRDVIDEDEESLFIPETHYPTDPEVGAPPEIKLEDIESNDHAISTSTPLTKAVTGVFESQDRLITETENAFSSTDSDKTDQVDSEKEKVPEDHLEAEDSMPLSNPALNNFKSSPLTSVRSESDFTNSDSNNAQHPSITSAANTPKDLPDRTPQPQETMVSSSPPSSSTAIPGRAQSQPSANLSISDLKSNIQTETLEIAILTQRLADRSLRVKKKQTDKLKQELSELQVTKRNMEQKLERQLKWDEEGHDDDFSDCEEGSDYFRREESVTRRLARELGQI